MFSYCFNFTIFISIDHFVWVQTWNYTNTITQKWMDKGYYYILSCYITKVLLQVPVWQCTTACSKKIYNAPYDRNFVPYFCRHKIAFGIGLDISSLFFGKLIFFSALSLHINKFPWDLKFLKIYSLILTQDHMVINLNRKF